VLTAPANERSLGAESRSDSGDYLLSLVTPNALQGYVAIAQANPAGRQNDDVLCQRFAIDEAGRRRSAMVNGILVADSEYRCWG
jgi:hypothetical protein